LTQKLQIYKCEKCGNIIEILNPGAGTLVCCNEPMILLNEQTADSSKEKHVPVTEKIDCGYKVTVGSIPHPMLEKHFIQWIQLIHGNKSYRQFLNPGENPESLFTCMEEAEIIAREYCNIHGLWKNQ